MTKNRRPKAKSALKIERRGGARPGAGRPKGSGKVPEGALRYRKAKVPSGAKMPRGHRGMYKVVERQEELAILCRQSAPEVFAELLRLAFVRGEPAVQLGAIREIFDRGFGRPKQVQVFEGNMRITHEQALREINRRLENPVDLDRGEAIARAREQVRQLEEAKGEEEEGEPYSKAAE